MFDALPASPVPHLIGTNASPSVEEIDVLESFIVILQQDILTMDEEMARMNERMDTMQQKRWALHDVVEKHKALLDFVPARELYPEILSEIFLHCQKGSVLDIVPEVPNSFHPKEGPLVLTQICRGWRSVALTTPQLW
ncbi:hypothetical protein BDQ12DRAFT_594278, partial [Crucibulum laeve]